MTNPLNNIVIAKRIARARRLKRMEELIASGELKIRTMTKTERTRFARVRAERMTEDYYHQPGRKASPPIDLYARDIALLRAKDKVPGFEVAA